MTALHLDFGAAVSGEGPSQQPAMLGEGVDIGLAADALKHARRSLNVCEQEGDRSPREGRRRGLASLSRERSTDNRSVFGTRACVRTVERPVCRKTQWALGSRAMEWRLLEGVPGEEVRRLLSVARRRTFRRGEVVFHQRDPADSLHLVSKGRFKVEVMTPVGEPATIGIRGPGDSFGEMAIVGPGAKRSATVEALEDGETFCVIENEFRRLRREHPGVDQLLIDLLANEVRVLNERLLEALYVPVDRRVLKRLSALARLYGPADDGVVIPWTQDELAGLAGTTRPSVNQVLRGLEGAGLIELGRGRTIVRDPAALAARVR